MIPAKIVGMDRVRRKFEIIGQAAKKPLREALTQEGRLAAISLAKSTQPYGTGSRPFNQGRYAVSRDVYKVYATPAKAFKDISDEHFAKAFWLLIKQGHTDRAMKLLQAHGRTLRSVPWMRFDAGALHRRYRNQTTGRVTAKYPLGLVTNPLQLATYVKMIQDNRVGFGKSAWADVARQLGGVRGLKAEGDITANWITRRAGKGEIIWSGPEDNLVLTMVSKVRYGDRILPERDRRIAIEIARDRLIKSMLFAARAELARIPAAA